jgi:hypothetical protein
MVRCAWYYAYKPTASPAESPIVKPLKRKIMTNIERLQQAGLIEVNHPLTPDEVNSVNQLSSAEVDALISIKAKLGDDFFTRKVPVGDGHRMGTMIL